MAAAGMEGICNWTFVAECQPPKDVVNLLVQGERVYAAYKTVRDVAVFTDRRLIVRDAQGITGQKVETYSLPWDSVNMWSSENAGIVDFNSELELWTRAGHIKVNLRKGIDVRRFDHLLATCILG